MSNGELTSADMLTRYGMKELSGLFEYDASNAQATAGLVVYVNGRKHPRTVQARTGKAGHVMVAMAKGEPAHKVSGSVRVFERGHMPAPETLDVGSPEALF